MILIAHVRTQSMDRKFSFIGSPGSILPPYLDRVHVRPDIGQPQILGSTYYIGKMPEYIAYNVRSNGFGNEFVVRPPSFPRRNNLRKIAEIGQTSSE